MSSVSQNWARIADRRKRILALMTRASTNRAKLTSVAKDLRQRIGLCETCRHVRLIRSNRGSVFYQCDLSFTDSHFKKYPRLPVLNCRGYEQAGDVPATQVT